MSVQDDDILKPFGGQLVSDGEAEDAGTDNDDLATLIHVEARIKRVRLPNQENMTDLEAQDRGGFRRER